LARFRDIKKNRVKKKDTFDLKVVEIVPVTLKIKAFITDMFMIMMPILYITTYILLDGKDDFQSNDIARWISAIIYGATIISFWLKSGQTPGMKAYDIKVVDMATHKNLAPFQALVRYILFLFSAATLLLVFMPFFRKDRALFQDILSKSLIINATDAKN